MKPQQQQNFDKNRQQFQPHNNQQMQNPQRVQNNQNIDPKIQQQQQLQQQQQMRQQQYQQQQKQVQKDAKEKLKEIYEKQNPFDFDEELYKIAPELDVLQKLIDYEQKVDKMIRRKRFDLQEQFAKPVPQIKNILRVVVSHQFLNKNEQIQDNQFQQQQTFTHWNLELKGKLLTNNQEICGKYRQKKLTSFFNKIDFNFYDPKIGNIQWRKKEPNQDNDILTIEREGNQELNLTINLHLHHNPPQYKLSQNLSELVGKSTCTRSYALAAIWEYIKFQDLQDKDNKNIINNDELLRNIFGSDRMNIGNITAKLRELLSADEPLQIQYSLSYEQKPQVFDIEVDVPQPFGLEIMPFLSQKVVIDEKKEQATHPFIQLNQKIKKLDKKSLDYLERLKSHKFKRDSYLAYSLNPSLYIENILIQQNQLLKIMNQQSKPDHNDPTKLSYLMENEEEIEKDLKELLDELEAQRQVQTQNQQLRQQQQDQLQQQNVQNQQQQPNSQQQLPQTQDLNNQQQQKQKSQLLDNNQQNNNAMEEEK